MLPVESFPSRITNVYLILGDEPILIDTGGLSDAGNLLKALEESKFKIKDIKKVIVTHGHVDHSGGASFIKDMNSDVEIFVHELDLKTLSFFKETLDFTARYIEVFLKTAGVREEKVEKLVKAYLANRDFFKSVDVKRLEDSVDGMEVIHTPGHCPGQVCIIAEDVIFTSDHVLMHVIPLQPPESIMRFTGLGHYIESLSKVADLPVKLALPGHGKVIHDLEARVREIKKHSEERNSQILEICKTPKTILEISLELFGRKTGQKIIFALEETGAHVEYLWERGFIKIADPGIPTLWEAA